MTQTIISQYQIRFENMILDFQQFGKSIRKAVATNNIYLTELLNAYVSVEEMTEVLSSLNESISISNIEAENGTETVIIFIYHSKVDFYTSDDGFVYTMPTSDFKQIAEGWRDFLLTLPLNGPYTGK